MLSLLERLKMAADENIPKGIVLAWSNQDSVNITWSELVELAELAELTEKKEEIVDESSVVE